MIIVGVTPTNNTSYFTLSLVATAIKADRHAVYTALRKSGKYIGFSTGEFSEVCMPIDAAWRFIKDAKAGKVLKTARKHYKEKNLKE